MVHMEPLCESNFFMYLVYATDRSKAVVPVFLFNSVWLCSLYYGALHLLKSSRALCDSSFPLAL